MINNIWLLLLLSTFLLYYTDDISQNTAWFQIVTPEELMCVELIMIIKQSISWDHHISTTPLWMKVILYASNMLMNTCIISITHS